MAAVDYEIDRLLHSKSEYSWPNNCCMMTVRNMTRRYPRMRLDLIEHSLGLTEVAAMKYYLRNYENLGEAYLDVLKKSGWSAYTNYGLIAIFDGVQVTTHMYGGQHFIRKKFQLIGFRGPFEMQRNWFVWTQAGIDMVDFNKSDIKIVHRFNPW